MRGLWSMFSLNWYKFPLHGLMVMSRRVPFIHNQIFSAAGFQNKSRHDLLMLFPAKDLICPVCVCVYYWITSYIAVQSEARGVHCQKLKKSN